MSSSNDLDDSEACIAYLSHMLDLRVSELKAANHKMSSLVRQTHSNVAYSTKDSNELVISDSSIRLPLDEGHLSELVALKEAELLETDNKWKEALVCIADLKAQIQHEMSIRKEKDETIENLEDLLMLHQSESSEIEALKCTNLEIINRLDSTEKLNSSLVLELTTLQECIQAKEESIAQTLIEKDDLEESSTCYKDLNSVLSQELTKLESQLVKENQFRQQAEDDKKALQLEKSRLLEQIEILGGELALYQQGGTVSLCSQTSDVSNSQQASQTMVAKLEVTALQAEKEDLEQQLNTCKNELAAVKNKCSCRSDQVQQVLCDEEQRSQMVSTLRKMLAKVSAENSRISKALFEKSADLTRLGTELQNHKSLLIVQENQNMELVAQLLVLEDRIAESEVLCRDSRESTERMAETAVKNTDSSIQLQERLNSLTSCLETKANELYCCQAELDLLRCKYKTVSERYQQLLSHKNQLELSNRQLLEKLSRYQDRQPAAEICSKCVELAKLKLDFVQLKSSYDELNNKHSKTPVNNHQPEISIASYPISSVDQASNADVREGSASKRSRTALPLVSVSNICTPVTHPVKGTRCFLDIDSRSSQTVPNNRVLSEWSNLDESVRGSNYSLLDDEFMRDFETIEAHNSCPRISFASNDSNKGLVKLGKRQLFNKTSSTGCIPSVSQVGSSQSCNQDVVSKTLPMPCVKRAGGRASLSLSHRSPKSIV